MVNFNPSKNIFMKKALIKNERRIKNKHQIIIFRDQD